MNWTPDVYAMVVDPAVRAGVYRLAEATGRTVRNILDGRLRSLRKAGRIRRKRDYTMSGRFGWHLA